MWGFSDTYWPLVIPLGILERCVSKLCKTAVPIDAFPFGGGGGGRSFSARNFKIKHERLSKRSATIGWPVAYRKFSGKTTP